MSKSSIAYYIEILYAIVKLDIQYFAIEKCKECNRSIDHPMCSPISPVQYVIFQKLFYTLLGHHGYVNVKRNMYHTCRCLLISALLLVL